MKLAILPLGLLLAAMPLHAQPSGGGFTGPVKNSWTRIARLNAASAEAMPDAGYAFKPADSVRTFGQLIGHLANEHYMICSAAKGEANPHASTDYEKTTAKADLVKALKDSNAYCDGAYALDDAKLTTPAANRRDTPFSGLLMNVTHDSEHYGNLVTYLRMKGIVPPSSQPTR